MSNDLVQIQANGMLPVTSQDVEDLKNQRQLLKEFVSSQLKEAQFNDDKSENYGEGDYGKITGTKKRSLLKPGAEKLLKLFGLGVRFKLVDKEVDRFANFAMYVYKAEVYHLRTSVIIAECDAAANSQEIKYKSRTSWITSGKDKSGKPIRESKKEETPICDVLNTLMKMAQKRAMIGATILATQASDYFTQDMEDDKPALDEKEKGKEPEEKKEEGPPPICCEKPMIISKYEDKELGFPFYCLKCRKKVKR